MTKKQQKKTKNWLYFLVFLVILIGVGAVTYVVWNVATGEEETVQESAEMVEEETEMVNEEKVESENEDVTVEKNDSEVEQGETNAGKKVTQYEGEDPNKAAELTGVVTYAGVVGENLMIRTNIDQYLSEGSCELVISQNGNIIYSAMAEIVAAAATSSCQGFDVPATELGNGTAQIIINLSSGGKTGTLTSEVEL